MGDPYQTDTPDVNPIGPDQSYLTPEASAEYIQSCYQPSPVGQANNLISGIENSARSNAVGDAEIRLARFMLSHSPYLTRLADKNQAFFLSCLRGDASATDIYQPFQQLTAETSEADVMQVLRRAKACMALYLACDDIAGREPTKAICQKLSEFADKCLHLALGWLITRAYTAGDLKPPPDAYSPEPTLDGAAQSSGFAILALGKHGGEELNYSSDIDPIFLYDPEKLVYTGRKDVRSFCQKLSKSLIRLMDQTTADGYVFRMDMRLRPDPSSTPLAIPIGALESYYHSKALNWERAAFIKARVAAGDNALGNSFLKALAPWIWRRSIDFAALDELSGLKRQVEEQAAKSARGGSIDIKVGPGGIREIEFFTQIQQLLFAGRDADLRARDTQSALTALAHAGHISRPLADQLIHSYWQYRQLEHRLQMVHDAQTHSLPADQTQLDTLANFSGFADAASLKAWLLQANRFVRHHYQALLPRSAQTSPQQMQPLPDLHAGLAEHLDALGFDNPLQAAQLLHRWRSQEYRSLSAPRALSLLEDILPRLVLAFSQSPDPNAALISCDRLFERMPAGVPLLSLLRANPEFFARMTKVMTVSTAMADALSRRPERWGAALEPGYMAAMTLDFDFAADLQSRLDTATSYEDALDISRIYKADSQMRISLQLIEQLISSEVAAVLLGKLADAVLLCVFQLAEKRLAARHGRFGGCAMYAVALGRYGGGQLTTESDLDLIFYYSTPKGLKATAMSDGPKPLSTSQYFSRLGQQVITAITSPTREGVLYELDARLRPCGAQGPMVVHSSSVEKYYHTPENQGGAWVWEYMAQTRAREIMLTQKAGGKAAQGINYQNLLSAISADPKLSQDIYDMHQKLKSGRDDGQHWDIKLRRGGLVDIEFIIQYLLLRDIVPQAIACPPKLQTAISLLAKYGSLTSDQAKSLLDAVGLYEKLLLLLRLCFKSSRNVPKKLPVGVADLLIAQTGASDQQSLRKKLEDCSAVVLDIFNHIFANAIKPGKSV